ncbi:MAG: helix-turn-helix domain-containing protein [Lachnospiraceae bacterium]|nr:helix-turn-helix domain-containing protein [Lachnospiraceae bacterium]
MIVKEIRELSGLSQPQFSQKYNIPLPTLRHWEQGQRECPQYVLELLEFKVREDLKVDSG